jgi:hypothetical protein
MQFVIGTGTAMANGDPEAMGRKREKRCLIKAKLSIGPVSNEIRDWPELRAERIG